MREWVKACDVATLRAGEPHATQLAGVPIGLFFDGRECFALENICTHAYAMMTDGFWDGDVIECPLHGATFELKTGRCTALPATRDLKSYETKIVDGVVYVRVGGHAACDAADADLSARDTP